jgi:hypothetical protein
MSTSPASELDGRVQCLPSPPLSSRANDGWFGVAALASEEVAPMEEPERAPLASPEPPPSRGGTSTPSEQGRPQTWSAERCFQDRAKLLGASGRPFRHNINAGSAIGYGNDRCKLTQPVTPTPQLSAGVRVHSPSGRTTFTWHTFVDDRTTAQQLHMAIRKSHAATVGLGRGISQNAFRSPSPAASLASLLPKASSVLERDGHFFLTKTGTKELVGDWVDHNGKKVGVVDVACCRNDFRGPMEETRLGGPHLRMTGAKRSPRLSSRQANTLRAQGVGHNTDVTVNFPVIDRPTSKGGSVPTCTDPSVLPSSRQSSVQVQDYVLQRNVQQSPVFMRRR